MKNLDEYNKNDYIVILEGCHGSAYIPLGDISYTDIHLLEGIASKSEEIMKKTGGCKPKLRVVKIRDLDDIDIRNYNKDLQDIFFKRESLEDF
jgi:hypothetical protein